MQTKKVYVINENNYCNLQRPMYINLESNPTSEGILPVSLLDPSVEVEKQRKDVEACREKAAKNVYSMTTTHLKRASSIGTEMKSPSELFL